MVQKHREGRGRARAIRTVAIWMPAFQPTNQPIPTNQPTKLTAKWQLACSLQRQSPCPRVQHCRQAAPTHILVRLWRAEVACEGVAAVHHAQLVVLLLRRFGEPRHARALAQQPRQRALMLLQAGAQRGDATAREPICQCTNMRYDVLDLLCVQHCRQVFAAQMAQHLASSRLVAGLAGS